MSCQRTGATFAARLANGDADIDTSLALLEPGHTPCPTSSPGATPANYARRRWRNAARRAWTRKRRACASSSPNCWRSTPGRDRKIAPEADTEPAEPRFAVEPHDKAGQLDFEVTLDGQPIAPPEGVKQLLASVWLDFGDIPPEYLVPAGDGEYDASRYQEQPDDPDAVWQGAYHEKGATLYPEWDMGRQHYRKNWCVMREKPVPPLYDDFPRDTLEKHGGLVRHLRKAFEAMRDENRLLKRQEHGDDVDIDALVEALADARDGREMSERLFVRQHRAERNIAVVFMVDMSGSTRGWINDAEREALLLLCEALERLGDRYAIYGFSGITRKRCELFRVKTFDDAYDAEVKARISGIKPQEYTAWASPSAT
jgi:nitric oxide reductase NorD protein